MPLPGGCSVFHYTKVCDQGADPIAIKLRKQKKELSEYKAMSMTKEFGMDFFQALWCSEELAVQLLLKLCEIIAQHGTKSRRYTKKSAVDIMESLGIVPMS